MTARATLAAMATVARAGAARALAELEEAPALPLADRLALARQLEEHARDLVEALAALAGGATSAGARAAVPPCVVCGAESVMGVRDGDVHGTYCAAHDPTREPDDEGVDSIETLGSDEGLHATETLSPNEGPAPALPAWLVAWLAANPARVLRVGVDVGEGVHVAPGWYAEAEEDGESVEVVFADELDEALEGFTDGSVRDAYGPGAEGTHQVCTLRDEADGVPGNRDGAGYQPARGVANFEISKFETSSSPPGVFARSGENLESAPLPGSGERDPSAFSSDSAYSDLSSVENLNDFSSTILGSENHSGIERAPERLVAHAADRLELRRRCEVPEATRFSLEAHALAFVARSRANAVNKSGPGQDLRDGHDSPFAAVVQAAWDEWVLADESRREALCRDDRGRAAAHAYLAEVLEALFAGARP